MVREIKKIIQKSGNFNMLCSNFQKLNKQIYDDDCFPVITLCNPVIVKYISPLLVILMLKGDLKPILGHICFKFSNSIVT